MNAQVAGGAMAAPVERDALLEALHAAHFRQLVRLAALLLDDPGACEDVVQEAFVRLYAGWGRLRDHDKALAYLRHSVVNLSRSRLRRVRIARQHWAAARPPAAVDDAAVDVIRRDEVVRALRGLQRRQREVLVLRFLGGWPEAETAEALGLSVGSVKAYASRGLARLRAELEEKA